MPAECCKDKWPTIPDDEPVFIIMGKDKLAIETVMNWMDLASEAGVNKGKIVRVREHLDAIARFQQEHPERCKIPD
jgi:hypothetical protein